MSSVREVLAERVLILLLAAVMVFFMAVGVLFRTPLEPSSSVDTSPGSGTSMHQLGLDDPSSDHGSWIPDIVRQWGGQQLIGH